MAITTGSYVVVTTEWRGVFFGRLVSEDAVKRVVTIDQAQNCVKWDTESHGFMGLASGVGIDQGRIGPICGEQRLWGVTSLVEASEDAVAAWKECPWV